MEKMTREEMINELEQYFEAAGFKDVKSKKLKSMDQSELEKLYDTTFNESLSNGDEISF